MKNTAKLRDRLTRAFSASTSTPQVAVDLAFHLTDWDHDLDELNALFEHPEEYGDEEIVSLIYKFLAHVPNHLAAAKKLSGMGPIEDVFSVGVLQEEMQD